MAPEWRECPVCASEFVTKPHGRPATYCSRECQVAALYDRTPSRHYAGRKADR